MEEWAIGCGVEKADGVGIIVSEEAYNYNGGAFAAPDVEIATQIDLPQGQIVIQVPHEMILTGTKARDELGPIDSAEELLERLQATDHLPQFYLLLKVLKEYEAGVDSPWYYWLNSLPRYFSNGSSLTNLCSELLPPLVGNLVRQERVRFRQFIRAIKDANCLSLETRENEDLFKWAFAIVYTRSFPVGNGDDAQLVPMAELCNHQSEPDVELQTDPNTGNCVVVTTKDVRAGSALRMTYADPTNPSHLFARYGFLDETSPATFCKIMLPSPTKDVIEIGYDPSRMLFYKETGEVSEEVWDVLLYNTVLGYSSGSSGGGGIGDKARDRRAFYEAHMNGDYETKQRIHGMYYSETVALLFKHVDAFLKELDVLTEKASLGDINQHPRLPLLMRHNAFVKDTFFRVRLRLSEY